MFKSIRGIKKEIAREPGLFLIMLPVLLFYLVFKYIPFLYNIGAFKDFTPSLGLIGSPMAGKFGFANFYELFAGGDGGRLLANQFRIGSVYLLIGFPLPIILAALTHELRGRRIAHIVQAITIAPMFVSSAVICGLISQGAAFVGVGDNPAYFPLIYSAASAFQETGWWALIYAVMIRALNKDLADAARLCGAGSWGVFRHATLPGILHGVCALFLLRVSLLFTVDYERVVMLSNSANIEAADVLPTYAYRLGIIVPDYSMALAAGVVSGIMNMAVAVAGFIVYRKIVMPWFEEDFIGGAVES